MTENASAPVAQETHTAHGFRRKMVGRVEMTWSIGPSPRIIKVMATKVLARVTWLFRKSSVPTVKMPAIW